MPNGRCRLHGGLSPGAPKGNKNALKHGRYTGEAIMRRKSIAALRHLKKADGLDNPRWASAPGSWSVTEWFFWNGLDMNP